MSDSPPKLSASKKKILYRRFASNPLALFGAIFFLFFFLMALIGDKVAPYPFDAQAIADRLQGPSSEHFCGTDQFGRDVFSRIIVGTRSVFFLGGTGTMAAAFFGLILGLAAGYYGGLFDELAMRVCDGVMSLPSLLLALVFISLSGPSTLNLVMIISILYTPIMARVVRSLTLEIKNLAYVEAARIRGESAPYIIFVEIMPNTLPPVFVEMSMRFSYSIFLVASLGFLGLGVQPPSPDWGMQINEARGFLTYAPWVLLCPAASIAVLVVSTSLFSDGIRNMLQPSTGKR
ncbi:MAG: ABC transporter permease [Deltaproteobacteria bacterium]|jgi:peptide/nickel transport system permease protein|nr:ABC transporter permease [Deltaproteobacteria bacterium]